ncbi:hypothetical protein OG563_42750 [Nocardia vinacea]|uniref:Uncharacterized protein n=1 Tax=Nocardia vinacea TaxID=96468 RepID=A0ABZ1YR41_9NOCA|nr:hypothetical protein [Nocardia vinacea]
MSDRPEIPVADGRATLDQAHRLQDADACGDEATVSGVRADLVTCYGHEIIVGVMLRRHERERLGFEVELLRLIGPTLLYGDSAGQEPSTTP